MPRQSRVGFAAGDDRGRHAVVGLPGQEFLRARRAARCDRRPDVIALGKLLHRIAAQQQIVEHALPDMFVEVRSKLRIGNAQAARRFEQPRAIDHAVLGVVEVVRQAEDELGRAGQIVPRLAGEACHQGEPERDIGHRCRCKAGIDPVGHMDVHARHHQAHVDERRTEEPVEPGTPVLVERDHDDREHHAHHQRDLNEALVPARTGPGGNGVENIDDVLAAADRENLDHAA